jgi:MFS family permease
VASLAGIGRVLGTRNTRIYFGCSMLSWSGQWVQKVATDWLAWELTHSPAWVGVIAFCNLAPSVIASPFAGAAADRMDRIRLTVSSQMITAAHAATLAVLVFTGTIRIEVMAALEIVLGTTQAFAAPARQALLPGMVSRADMPSAVALNSLCFNVARSVGPMIGGLIVAFSGVLPCLLVNMAGFLAASLTMPSLRLDKRFRRGHAPSTSVVREAFEGIQYVVRHPGVGPLFLFATLIGVLVRSVPETLPPFVDRLFQRGPEGLAILSSSIGMAALVGGLAVAMHGRLSGLCKLSIAGGTALALATLGFVATGSFTVAVVCAAAMGMATTIHGVSVQTLLQSSTSGAMLGRVLSLWQMITRAGPALGALGYGVLAEWAGLRVPVLLGGGLGLLACLWALRQAPVMERNLERGESGD